MTYLSALQAKELRVVAVDIWMNGSGGWGEDAHWSTGDVPGSADDAAIDAAGVYTVSVASNTEFAAQSLTLNAKSATLRVDGSLTFSNGLSVTAGTLTGAGSISLTGGALSEGKSGTVTAKSLEFRGTASLLTDFRYTGSFYGAGLALNGHQFVLQGKSALQGCTVSGTGTFKTLTAPGESITVAPGLVLKDATQLLNRGTLDLIQNDEDTGFILVGDSASSTASVVNDGTLKFDANAGIGDGTGHSGTTKFTNSGTLAKTGGTGVSNVSVNMTSTGAIKASAGTLRFDAPANSFGGSIEAQNGGRILFAGAGSGFTAAITGKGTVVFNDGTNLLSAGATLSPALVVVENTAILSLDSDIACGHSFQQTGGTVSLGKHTLSIAGTASLLAGSVTAKARGTLELTGARATLGSEGHSYTIADAATLSNRSLGATVHGSIVVGADAQSKAKLVNEAGATMTLADNSGISHAIANQVVKFVNHGTLEATGKATVDIVFSSTNTVRAVGLLDRLTFSTFFDNSFGGSISGKGTVVFSNGDQILQSGLAISIGSLRFTSGRIVLKGDVTADSHVVQTGGTFHTEGHTLTITERSFLVGATDGSGGVVVTAAATFGAPTSTYTFENNVTFEAKSTATIYTVHLGNGAGESPTFIIDGTARLLGDITRGDGGTGTPSLMLNGTLLDRSLTPFTIEVPVLDNGTARVSGGSLDFQGGVNGSGKVSVGGGGSVEFGNQAGTSHHPLTVQFGKDGTIVIDSTVLFHGTLSGFGDTDMLDLKNFNFVPGSTEASYSGDASGGVLKVSNGSSTAFFDFSGDFNPAGFGTQADGHGGTGIVYAPPHQAPQHAAVHGHPPWHHDALHWDGWI